MVFSSAVFLFLFLPVVLAVYFLVPSRAAKNVLLLAASLVFYAWGEPAYVLLMIASMAANWLFGLKVDQERPNRRLWLAASLVFNLAVLGFFKYEGFLAHNVNAIVGATVIPDLELPLPIGICFYTLQAVSYVIDVYRGHVAPQRNALYLGMYIAMFPQLVAGPIVRYSTIEEQVLDRREDLRGFSQGVRLFAVGLAKKCLLANTAAILADQMLADGGSVGAVGAWAGIVAYTFQIFFDFSGYSDMAIGLGMMFGFRYLRNFNYPYIAKSATEFWRRWHISLGSFFRDYVYIPLGGNRRGKSRWLINLMIVWGLTGVWHGAAWNFVLWGLFYGALLIVEKLWLLRRMERLPAVLQHLYGIAVFMFGWLIFWIEDPAAFGEYLLALGGAFGATGTSTVWELNVWAYWPVLLICAVASTPVLPWLRAKVVAWASGRSARGFLEDDLPGEKRLSVDGLCDTRAWFDALPSDARRSGRLAVQALAIAADVGALALLALSILSVVAGTFNPFIYFRF